MPETYITADTHLDHDTIRIWCNRPFDTIEKMNESIVEVWNNTIDKKDLVYIVGDFAFKNHRKWVNILNGKKILILGNHDSMPQDVLALFTGEQQLNASQFREVHQLLVRKVGGLDITFCHYPLRAWDGSCRDGVCVCGHSHGRCSVALPGNIEGGLILDSGWDVCEKPLHIEEIRVEMKRKRYLLEKSGKFNRE